MNNMILNRKFNAYLFIVYILFNCMEENEALNLIFYGYLKKKREKKILIYLTISLKHNIHDKIIKLEKPETTKI